MPVRIWKVGLRGRNKDTDKLYDWRIEGNDGADGNWDTLYASPDNSIAKRVFINIHYEKFLIDSIVKYEAFRLFCNRAESNRPGVSVFQLFVYDDE